MRDLDLLLRLSGRIVKGCRLPGSVAFRAAATTIQAACRGMKLSAAGMRPWSQAERGIRQAHQHILRLDNQQQVETGNVVAETVGGIAGGEIACCY
jgi:hypothetical protein